MGLIPTFPLHKRNLLGVGALASRHSHYSKIRLHRRAVYTMRSSHLVGCIEEATKKVVQLSQADPEAVQKEFFFQ